MPGSKNALCARNALDIYLELGGKEAVVSKSWRSWRLWRRLRRKGHHPGNLQSASAPERARYIYLKAVDADMGLMLRMTAAISSLFLIFLSVLLTVGYLLGAPVFLVVGLALLFVLLQWAIGPLIIKWIYKIQWVELSYFDDETISYIQRVVADEGIAMPKFGVIDDGNPNAFCFGWTRNKSHLVVTRGIFDYCDDDEARAVIGHELGHIVHNDFVIMTMVAAVPILLYIIARSCIEIAKRPHYGGKNDPTPILFVVAAIAYVFYFISNFIVLFISRCREYWADDFAARSTDKPEALITALVKIAYGLATISKESQEAKKKDKRYENALMIFDSKVARNLAFAASSVRDRHGEVSIQDMKEAMAWDMWNPWAKYFEFFMTHPLPAKRIIALDKVGESMGKAPYLEFDLVQPESYWDEFFQDVFAKYSFLLPLLVGIGLCTIEPTAGLGVMVAGVGSYWYLYLTKYRYPFGFRQIELEALIDDPKASPIRGFPVKVSGTIIGRGQPGLIFNEDMKLDDGRALMLLDYHQVSKFIDFFVGLFGTEKYIDEENVVVTGWYRRVVTPYIEIYRMEVHDKTRKLHTRSTYSFLSAILGVLGVVIMFSGSGFVIGIPIFLALVLIMLPYYIFIQNKYLREYPKDEQGM